MNFQITLLSYTIQCIEVSTRSELTFSLGNISSQQCQFLSVLISNILFYSAFLNQKDDFLNQFTDRISSDLPRLLMHSNRFSTANYSPLLGKEPFNMLVDFCLTGMPALALLQKEDCIQISSLFWILEVTKIAVGILERAADDPTAKSISVIAENSQPNEDASSFLTFLLSHIDVFNNPDIKGPAMPGIILRLYRKVCSPFLKKV